MPLSNQQQHAVEVLDWLLSEDDVNRRTGRTVAMAVALIRQAVRHPGRFIRYMDHVPGLPIARQTDIVRNIVQRIIHHDRTVSRLAWTYRDRDFRMEADRPALPNWWPDQGALPEGPPPLGIPREVPRPGELPAAPPPQARTAWERLRED
jgi:hypothetical protein